jgi:hypothetical protein
MPLTHGTSPHPWNTNQGRKPMRGDGPGRSRYVTKHFMDTGHASDYDQIVNGDSFIGANAFGPDQERGHAAHFRSARGLRRVALQPSRTHAGGRAAAASRGAVGPFFHDRGHYAMMALGSGALLSPATTTGESIPRYPTRGLDRCDGDVLAVVRVFLVGGAL